MGRILLGACFAMLVWSDIASAQARTCTARDQLCRNECVANFRNSGGCNRICDQRKAGCMQNGCWGTGADSRCNLTKS